MLTRWQQYFEDSYAGTHSILEAAVEHWQFYTPVYHRMKTLLRPGSSILDIGSGYGFSDIYLSACGYDVTGVEYDQGVLQNSLAVAQQFKSAVRFEEGTAFDLSRYYNKFDLAYSVGVLEHFDRDVTVRLVAEKAKCAPLVMTMIPTRFIKYSAGLTDERIYSPGEFAGIVRDAGLDVLGIFAYGDVPGMMPRLARGVLPYGVWRWIRDGWGIGMGLGCIGRRRADRLSK